MNNEIEELFIFGAGASNASAVTPLGNELVWNYYELAPRRQLELDNTPDLTEENRVYANYAKFLELAEEIYQELKLKGIKDKWEKQLKRLLSKNGSWFGPFDYGLNKKHYVDEMVRILQEKGKNDGVELVRQLVLEHITEKASHPKDSLYNKFVKSLIQTSRLKDVSIISINFDYLLEEELEEKFVINGNSFDYLIDFDMIDTNRTNCRKNGIPLIKLNGSLNWGICYECRKTILLPLYVGKDDYKNLCCKMSEKCRGKIYPLIFLPHEEKIPSIYKKLQSKTEEVLKQADKITVIGYSFPPYDSHIKNLFKEHTNPDAVIEIVDYEKDAGKRKCKEKEILGIVKPIFPNSKEIKISLDGFQGYMDQLRCTPCMK